MPQAHLSQLDRFVYTDALEQVVLGSLIFASEQWSLEIHDCYKVDDKCNPIFLLLNRNMRPRG